MRISDWSSDVCSSDLDRQFGLEPLDTRRGSVDDRLDKHAVAHKTLVALDILVILRIDGKIQAAAAPDHAAIRLPYSLDVLHHFRIEGRKLRRGRRRNVEAAGTKDLAGRNKRKETARERKRE